MDWGGEGWWGILGLVEEAGGVGGGFGRVGMLYPLFLHELSYTTYIHTYIYIHDVDYEKRKKKKVESMIFGVGSGDLGEGSRMGFQTCCCIYGRVANNVMVGVFFCLSFLGGWDGAKEYRLDALRAC